MRPCSRLPTPGWRAGSPIRSSWRCAGRTDLDAVGHAAQSLLQAQSDLAGCALTAVDMRKYKLYGREAGSYYGQYRGYYVD